MVGTTTRPVRSARPALLAALGLVALCSLVGASSAWAEPAKTLGNTSRTPAPACPGDPCEAVGSVSGYQLVADGVRAPFKAREDGWIVAWALDLSEPKNSQINFFADFYQSGVFGLTPTARISVIKRRDGRDYKLKGQSSVVPLSTSFGNKETFTLTDPLKIQEGRLRRSDDPDVGPVVRGQPRQGHQRVARQPRRRQVRRHRQHQGRQAPAEGRIDPLLRLRLPGRAPPVLGLLHAPLS